MCTLNDKEAKMTGKVCGIMMLMVMVTLAGCGCGQWAEGTRQECRPADRVPAMKAAQDVLVGMGFQMDKYDVEAGIIRTKPLSGAQAFEVWRGDSAGGCNWAESSIHSLKRVVEMTFTQADGKVCMVCDAKTMRLSLPEKQAAGTAGAHAMFTRSSSQLMTTKVNPDQEKQMAWVDMGSDARLAEKILSGVVERLPSGKAEIK
jgi:hypothetical protein